MPTTYKVLGQSSATAPAATDYLNLVEDSSFENSTLALTAAGPSNSTYVSLSTYGMPLWAWGNDGTSTGIEIANVAYDATALDGTKATGFNVNNNNGITCHMYYGGGTAVAGATANTTSYFDATKAIPVTAGTTYYYGLSMHVRSATTKVSSPVMVINWFNTSNTVISSTSLTLTNNSANNWVRTVGSDTAPTGAVYATIRITFLKPSGQGQGIVFFDAIHFSNIASTNTTFPTPTGGIATLTAPFTKRVDSFWLGSANASDLVTVYAGAPVDLYTVPSATQTVASTVTVSNLGTSASTYRIAVLPSGQTLAKKHWLVFDAPIAANSVETYTIGMTLATGDIIKVAAESADVSFSAFGSEIS